MSEQAGPALPARVLVCLPDDWGFGVQLYATVDAFRAGAVAMCRQLLAASEHRGELPMGSVVAVIEGAAKVEIEVRMPPRLDLLAYNFEATWEPVQGA